MTEGTNPPTDELAALYELAKSCPGGVEGCEWWPDVVKYDIGWGMQWTFISKGTPSDTYVRMEPQHALDLIRAEAERWLSSEGWKIACVFEGVQSWLDVRTGRYLELPEALKHAMGDKPAVKLRRKKITKKPV